MPHDKKNQKHLAATVGIITILHRGERVGDLKELQRISNLFQKGFDDQDIELLTGYSLIRSEYETTTGNPPEPTYRTEFSST